MKILNFAIFILLIQFTAVAQENEELWEKNVKVILHDPMPNSLLSGTVKYRLNNKTYIGETVETNDYIYSLFDSIPYGEGTIELRATGYESQSYKISLIRNKTYDFYLGKPGSAYYARDGFQFPYQKRPGVYGLVADFEQIDSIEYFLDSLGVTIEQKLERYRFIQIRTSKKVNSAKFIFDLLEHSGISEAGEIYGQQSITGFFTTRISIQFTGARRTEIIKILEENGLTMISKSGTTYRCRITRESKGTVNEVASRLLKLDHVKYANPSLGDYRPAPTLH